MSAVSAILLRYQPPLTACTLALDMWATAVRCVLASPHQFDTPTHALETAVEAVEAQLAARPGAATRVRWLSPGWQLENEPLAVVDHVMLQPLADVITVALSIGRRFGPVGIPGHLCPCGMCGAARRG
ncbi:hypothetical protein BOTBODRAFT_182212 [Botryobasidium botryosum FD-172 SS1]|uniref:Uncharacterized protein n=1 Tax=Botryobasidium botryosum (strain FD-172 SS1) TaxID=930990 RepID=A0A067LS32_BOTB1|nr:hypothetical protein BOTBODRAFT_182212 [Botryobasidium botryosum FD-172 SS1]